MKLTKRFFAPISLLIVIVITASFANPKSFPLKGQNRFIAGVENYRVLVKFDPAFNPDIDPAGALTLAYQTPSKAVLAPVAKYNLTFSRAIPFSPDQLAALKTPKRHATDEKGFSILEFAGLLYVKSQFSAKEKLLEICDALEQLDEVEYCELEPQCEFPPPADIPPVTPALDTNQGYRKPTIGIDALYAWGLGIKGEGMRVADIEYYKGTPMNHEDYVDQKIKFCLPMPTGAIQQHARAVIGILVAAENGYGITGLVPKAQGFVAPEEHGRAAAALAAIDSLKKGDVILYEMQTGGPGGGYCPADYSQSLWDATKKASDAGVIVVAAAGNGNQNLDSSVYASYMNRGDNGSIIVGAGSASTAHNKLGFSTYGKRVNVQGWGERVFATGYGAFAKYGNDDNQSYTASFSGTSSASPIVTSAVALVQCYAKTKYNKILSSVEMRTLLIKTGIPQGTGGHIGPIPNVKAAFLNLDSTMVGIRDEARRAKIVSGGMYQAGSKLHYYVPAGGSQVTLGLYSINGSLAAMLLNEKQGAGNHAIDVSKQAGKALSPGLYCCRLETMNGRSTGKFTVR